MKKSILSLLCLLTTAIGYAPQASAETESLSITGVKTTSSTSATVDTDLLPNTGTVIWHAKASSTNANPANSNSAVKLGTNTYPFAGTLTLTKSAIPDNSTITKISITATTNKIYTVSATVNGNTFGESLTFDSSTASTKSLTGSQAVSTAANNIIINIQYDSNNKGNLTISKLEVEYESPTEIDGKKILGKPQITLDDANQKFSIASVENADIYYCVNSFESATVDECNLLYSDEVPYETDYGTYYVHAYAKSTDTEKYTDSDVETTSYEVVDPNQDQCYVIDLSSNDNWTTKLPSSATNSVASAVYKYSDDQSLSFTVCNVKLNSSGTKYLFVTKSTGYITLPTFEDKIITKIVLKTPSSGSIAGAASFNVSGGGYTSDTQACSTNGTEYSVSPTIKNPGVAYKIAAVGGNCQFTTLTIYYKAESRQETALSWVDTEGKAVSAVSAVYGGSDNVYPTLSSTLDGGVAAATYESSKSEVAEIATGGTITLRKAGETVISAYIKGNDTFKDVDKVSYTLTVTDPAQLNAVFVVDDAEWLSSVDGVLRYGGKVTIKPSDDTATDYTIHYKVGEGEWQESTSAVTLTINETTTVAAYVNQYDDLKVEKTFTVKQLSLTTDPTLGRVTKDTEITISCDVDGAKLSGTIGTQALENVELPYKFTLTEDVTVSLTASLDGYKPSEEFKGTFTATDMEYDWDVTTKAVSLSKSETQTCELNGKSWTITMTRNSSGTQCHAQGGQSNLIFGSTDTKMTSLVFKTEAFKEYDITGVVVNTKYTGTSASLSVKVGENAFGETATVTSTAADAEFTGRAAGDNITITWDNLNDNTKQIYVYSITVYYTKASTPLIDAPKFSVESGSTIDIADTVTLSCEEGATLTYSIDDAEAVVYTEGTEIKFDTTGEHTITAYASKDGYRPNSSKATYTVTNLKVDNIAAWIDAASQDKGNSYTVKNPVTVSFANGKAMYIFDDSGAIDIWGDDSSTFADYNAGDVISTVSATYSTNNGMRQMQNAVLGEKTSGDAPTPEVVTLDKINTTDTELLAQIVTVKRLTITSSTSTSVNAKDEDGNTIVVWNKFNNKSIYTQTFTLPTVGKTYNITGVVILYSTSGSTYMELAPTAEPEEVVPQEVTLSWGEGVESVETTLNATDFAAPELTVTAKDDDSAAAAKQLVTYSSSDTSVAAFNEDGTLEIKGAGTTTIKAEIPTNIDYSATAASYTLTVNKITATLSWGEGVEKVSAIVDREFAAPKLTVDPEEAATAVTYSSSNTEVAAFKEDGTLEIKGAGTTTITAAISADNKTYTEASATYDLTVTELTEVMLEWYRGDNELEGDVTATVDKQFIAPTLVVVADDEDAATAAVRYSSSNTDVATINETTGAITLLAAGETIITATIPETDITYYVEEAVSYTLIVGEAPDENLGKGTDSVDFGSGTDVADIAMPEDFSLSISTEDDNNAAIENNALLSKNATITVDSDKDEIKGISQIEIVCASGNGFSADAAIFATGTFKDEGVTSTVDSDIVNLDGSLTWSARDDSELLSGFMFESDEAVSITAIKISWDYIPATVIDFTTTATGATFSTRKGHKVYYKEVTTPESMLNKVARRAESGLEQNDDNVESETDIVPTDGYRLVTNDEAAWTVDGESYTCNVSDNLANGTSYEIKVVNGTKSYTTTLGMNSDGEVVTGLENVVVNVATGLDEWYTLQGVRVANPVGGIFIHRVGNRFEKVVVK